MLHSKGVKYHDHQKGNAGAGGGNPVQLYADTRLYQSSTSV